MSTAAVIFDNVSLGAIRILRRHSFVRLLLLLYLIWLHTWALFVLEWAVDLQVTDRIRIQLCMHLIYLFAGGGYGGQGAGFQTRPSSWRRFAGRCSVGWSGWTAAS